uniref:Saposin B-type domain-containing protein n=1 Tax=Maylandia zebra TaxID=106582 RepID=A0A3P9BA80_9CICH
MHCISHQQQLHQSGKWKEEMLRALQHSADDQRQMFRKMRTEMREGELPGKCWACKWILNKVKKLAGPNATAESLKSKLLSICDEIGLLKPLCRKFVKVHLEELIEELTTICVNMGACKPREVDLFFYPKEGGPDTEIKEFQ